MRRPYVGVTAIELGSRQPGFGASVMQSSNAGYGGPYYFAPPYPVRTVEETPPVLVRGSTGRWVAYVQSRLGLVPTGVYDGRTEAAVRSVQLWAGLPQTGATDLATWQAIAALPQPGASVPPVDYYGPSYYGPLYYPSALYFSGRASSGGFSSSGSGGGGRMTGGR